MSAIAPPEGVDGDSAEDHAYFRAVESRFLELRGAATLLAPSDWQAAAAWRRLGVPLALVERVMVDLFEKRRARGGRRISSLRYFGPAVEAAFEELRALSAGGERPELAPEPLIVEERLARLAAALPPEFPDRELWGERIRAIARAGDGGLEAVEASLAALDAELRAAALDPADRDARAGLEAELAGALAPLHGRLPEEELSVARERLRAQLLRRRLALPLLSLFSPEARLPPPDLDAR